MLRKSLKLCLKNLRGFQKIPIQRTYKQKVIRGETYHICKCGLSKTQPLCDEESHKKTDVEPHVIIAGKTGNVIICPCGKNIRSSEDGYCTCVKIGALICAILVFVFMKRKFLPWASNHVPFVGKHSREKRKAKKEKKRLKKLKKKEKKMLKKMKKKVDKSLESDI